MRSAPGAGISTWIMSFVDGVQVDETDYRTKAGRADTFSDTCSPSCCRGPVESTLLCWRTRCCTTHTHTHTACMHLTATACVCRHAHACAYTNTCAHHPSFRRRLPPQPHPASQPAAPAAPPTRTPPPMPRPPPRKPPSRAAPPTRTPPPRLLRARQAAQRRLPRSPRALRRCPRASRRWRPALRQAWARRPPSRATSQASFMQQHQKRPHQHQQKPLSPPLGVAQPQVALPGRLTARQHATARAQLRRPRPLQLPVQRRCRSRP